jgi:hypothetical protein
MDTLGLRKYSIYRQKCVSIIIHFKYNYSFLTEKKGRKEKRN